MDRDESGAPPFWAMVAVTVLVALAMCILVARPMIGGPIPNPSRPVLTAELLVGRWEYAWGPMKDGWIEFFPDGRYQARHDKLGENWYMPRHAGQYEVRDGMIILTEGVVSEGYATVADRVYEVVSTTDNWPVIDGEYGTTRMKLSKQIKGTRF